MSVSLLSNSELLSLIKLKHHQAFEELYNRYWEKVFVICNNRLNNFEISKDLVQDIFVSLWNNDELDRIQNIEAYLYQCCKYAVIKEFQKSMRYDNVSPNEIHHLDRETEFDLNAILDAKLLDGLLQTQIDNLPERTRIIFNYSRKEHLSSKEIAVKLEISHRTVENQISFALKELRKFLQNVKSIVIF